MTITPRITQRLMVDRSLASLQSGLGRLSATQEKLSTGRLLNRPSDSPTGTNDAMRLRSTISQDTQHARNAQDGISWLGRADTTLTGMNDSVRRVRDLVVQAASTGSSGADARAAIATEVSQLRDSLLADANTQHLGRPIFGGTTAGSAAYDATGAYVGDGNPVVRTIGDNQSLAVNVTGPSAFAVGGDDLFTVLDDVVTALRTDPTQVGATLGRLDAVAGQMRTALADVGTRYARIEASATQLASATLENQSSLSTVENVDVAEAIMNLQMQEVAYQAALGATARVLQPSLLDFLR